MPDSNINEELTQKHAQFNAHHVLHSGQNKNHTLQHIYQNQSQFQG